MVLCFKNSIYKDLHRSQNANIASPSLIGRVHISRGFFESSFDYKHVRNYLDRCPKEICLTSYRFTPYSDEREGNVKIE